MYMHTYVHLHTYIYTPCHLVPSALGALAPKSEQFRWSDSNPASSRCIFGLPHVYLIFRVSIKLVFSGSLVNNKKVCNLSCYNFHVLSNSYTHNLSLSKLGLLLRSVIVPDQSIFFSIKKNMIMTVNYFLVSIDWPSKLHR